MPATYSRVMMDVIRNMHKVDLGYHADALASYNSEKPPNLKQGYLGTASVAPWLDDLTIRSGAEAQPGYGVKGHIKLLKL
eukprot:4602980-Prymnesium_polylepis.1